MTFIEIDEYLHKLHYTDLYKALPLEDRERIAFTAEEMLKSYYDDSLVTFKAVALQTLYLIEGAKEDFLTMKRQGVKSFSLEGMNFSFEPGIISPEVVALIEKSKVTETTKKTAYVGRLI
ncbi:hypothetical protein ACQKM1_22320 [Peribacillus frigoritolerans]|uniref:hypothetical protein n=1 Tax=Peribacillus frigoritolerans TaxID=450367 RepID=UPI003D06BB83